MSLKILSKIGEVWRERFGRWSLDDPRPMAKTAPYTFYIPQAFEVAALERGDLAKLIFRGDPPGPQWERERMWVEVREWDGKSGVGELANTPHDIPQLKVGTLVPFRDYEVIDLIYADQDTGRRPRHQTEREWFDRCMVDESVANGQSPVGYLYREEPFPLREGEEFPDSGWRIRSGFGDEEPVYVALGSVLNHDDSWVGLIDAPVGSAFERDWDFGEYVQVGV